MNSGNFHTWKAALAALAAVVFLASTGALERLDRAWFDALQRWTAGSAPMPENTALVLIDEQSLQALGEEPFTMRWPWPRGAFAAMLAGLHASGAEAIAVDLIFFENSSEAEQDALLGAVAAGLTEVTLGAVPEKLPAVWPEEFRNEHAKLFSNRTRWGFVRSNPDSDSVIRTYPRDGSLAEAVLETTTADYIQTRSRAPLRWRGNLEQLRARGLPIVPAAPFVAAGWEILDTATEAAPDLDPTALATAIDAQPRPEGEIFDLVRGKTVFVGANAAGTFDAIATPVGAPEPGVITHWTAFASLRADDFITPLGAWPGWIGALLAIGGVAFTGRRGIGLRLPASAALAVAVVAAAGSALAFLAGFWATPGLPLAAAAITFTAVAVASFQVERARKREIQGWFGAYVSPSVVDRLVADPNALALGGERRELTMFFSDIAGFTTLGERLPADELVGLVNRFLESQTACILDHGGYLDKYIGDAIMAVFGSPEELENDALAACRAALDCRAALEKLNDSFEREHGLRLGMRIGINTGEVVVGNVGSTRKRNYTVLGDAVNLASRLEGANKETGTSTLIGPTTAARVSKAMVTRPVARLQVKGKTQAVEVHELLAARGEADEATVRFAETFARGFDAFCMKQFDKAEAAFVAAAVLRPQDLLTTHYLQTARELATTPPAPDWQPIHKLETK